MPRAYRRSIFACALVDMGGRSSKQVSPDTSYANFLLSIEAIQNESVSRQQRKAIAAFLQSLRPIEPHDREAVANLTLQYNSCMPISRQMYVQTLFYFTLCESSLRQKFLNDAVLARDYATVAAIEKNPLF
jgi:hypothetical protein